MVTGDKPAAPIQKGLPELQAQVAVNQCGDRLPQAGCIAVPESDATAGVPFEGHANRQHPNVVVGPVAGLAAQLLVRTMGGHRPRYPLPRLQLLRPGLAPNAKLAFWTRAHVPVWLM